MLYKKELQYETLILWEQNILQIPAEQPSQIQYMSNKLCLEKVFLRDLRSLAKLSQVEPPTL